MTRKQKARPGNPGKLKVVPGSKKAVKVTGSHDESKGDSVKQNPNQKRKPTSVEPAIAGEAQIEQQTPAAQKKCKQDNAAKPARTVRTRSRSRQRSDSQNKESVDELEMHRSQMTNVEFEENNNIVSLGVGESSRITDTSSDSETEPDQGLNDSMNSDALASSNNNAVADRSETDDRSAFHVMRCFMLKKGLIDSSMSEAELLDFMEREDQSGEEETAESSDKSPPAPS